MKKIKINSFFVLFLGLLFSFSSIAQSDTATPTGLPGDGLSLEGVLEVFKNASNIEDFEKALNQENNYVNNLDLNEDGKTDFIKVVDHMDTDVHAIVLQVDMDAKSTQDVAVIEIEKTGNENATLQIVGDADVYGGDTFVEPYEMTAEINGKGPAAEVSLTRVIVNVWFWPSVRYVYRPVYRPYVSPWRYSYYPVRWWTPWKVRSFGVCHSYRVKHYHPRFRRVNTHRVVRAHKIYTPKRKTTTVVRTRTTRVVATNKQVGVGKRATKTTVVKTNNGRAVGKRTTTSKGAKVNPNNKVVGKKTTTTRVAKTNGNKAAVGKKKTTTKRTATKSGKTAKKKKVTRKNGRNL